MTETVVDSDLTWTSVPRWEPPAVPAASSYLACSFGAAGLRRAEALLSGADADVPVRMAAFPAGWEPWAEAELRRLLAGCHMGVRIVLAGPEAAVTRAMAVARQCGAAAEELVAIADETPGGYVAGVAGRRVYCAGCRAAFEAVGAIGSIVTCPGCAARLQVDHRFSRPHAAYFGFPDGLDLHQ